MEATQRRKQLHARLLEVEKRHNQAEIARKTASSRNNVSRYARGSRMPLEFGAALCGEMGVNPAWLLLGEGMPWMADAPEPTARLAGNLLELVQAMNAVSQMRMGSLTGKHYLATLRELNDALRRYETLRERLNTRTSSLFSDLLKQFQTVLEKRDLAAADGLRKALTQLARLNDDEALHEQFDRQCAFHEHALMRLDKAQQYRRSVFYRALVRGELNSASCEDAHNLAMSHYANHQVHQARRVCESALALCAPAVLASEGGRVLDGLLGYLQVELGEVPAGLAKLQRNVPYLPGIFLGLSSGMVIRAGLLSGSLDFNGAFALGEPGRSKSFRLLQFAAWSEDPAILKRALRDCAGDGPTRYPVSSAIVEGPAFILRLIESKGRATEDMMAVPEGLGRAEELPASFNATLRAIVACRLHRLGGARQRALEDLATAENHLAAIPQEYFIDVLTHATHHRNALRLIDKGARGELGERRKRAIAFFRQGLAQGYGFMAAEKEAFSGRENHMEA
jgi:hypothetical protein